MDDKADLKKLIEVLQNSKRETEDLQFQELINLEDSDYEDDDQSTTQDYNFENPFSLGISTLYKYNPISSLKSEEKAVIDSCKDPDLKKILLLNRQKSMELIQMYKKFKDLLIECKQNILEKNDVVKSYFESLKAQKQSSGAWRVCAPYFKDKDFYVSPANADTVRKKENKELSYYDMMPLKKWNNFEITRLTQAIILNYNNNLIAELKKEIRLLEKEHLTEEQHEELAEKKARLHRISNCKKYETPPLGSDKHINWMRVTDVFIKDKHSDFECRAYWHLYLHPSINKSKTWKPDEIEKFQELVVKYDCQNWNLIAKELGTNRTGYIVAMYYFNSHYSSYKRGGFTLDEDRKLLELVSKFKIGTHIPWVHIVKHFKQRTRSQLHHRYTYYLTQVDKRTGKFSEAEDVIILLGVQYNGHNFKKVAEYLPDRSISQIKSRYSSNLKGILIKGIWTAEDDQMVLDYANKVKPQTKSWSGLTGPLQRCRGQIRQRYNLIKSFLEKHPGSTVKDVPRRKHVHKIEDSYNVVRRVADYFSERYPDVIPSMEDVEEVLEQCRSNIVIIDKLEIEDHDTKYNESTHLDDLLTDFFYNIHLQPTPTVNSENLRQAVDDVEIILDVLRVNLEIPDTLSDPRLDAVDMEIISELRKRNKLKRRGKEIKRLVPANFHTTTTMRGLMANYLDFKPDKKVNFDKKTNFRIERIFGIFDYPILDERDQIHDELLQLPRTAQEKLGTDRELFFHRFLSLFKWPAILTLDPPTREFSSVMENIPKDARRPPVKRTYSKRITSGVEQANKVVILDGDVKEQLKLKKVTDKSVIDNLLKDNTKKLFCMDTVQLGNQTKTLIKEVDLFALDRKDADVKNGFPKPYINKNENAFHTSIDADEHNFKTELPGPSNHEDDVMEDNEDDDDDFNEEANVSTSVINISDDFTLTNVIKQEKGFNFDSSEDDG